jgi:hypothetical protein
MTSAATNDISITNEDTEDMDVFESELVIFSFSF